MARRKKKQKKAQKAPAPDNGFGTLEAQVKSVRKELRTVRKSRPAPAPPPEPPSAPKRVLTEDELMSEAFEKLGDEFSGVEKYTGRGYAPDDVELVSERQLTESAEARGPDDLSADDLLFLEEMAAGVERMNAARDALREHEWSGASWRTDVELAALTERDLEAMELSPTERELLRRSRSSSPMPVLNIRRLSLREAMGELDAFVRSCRASRHRFARVVHGKGLGSQAGPVLKPEVIRWCEGAGADWVRAWAPEQDRSGRFGSLVVELRPE